MHTTRLLSMLGLLAACGGPTPPPPSEAPVPQPEPPSADVPTPAPAEPVILELPGWSLADVLDFEGERILRFRDGAATVELVRWWGYPEIDGGPMEVAHRSTVQVSGRELELVRTSMFQGRPAEVDAIFLKSGDWLARVSCEGCTQAQLDAVVGGLKVSW
jgi:hypothetical protein